MATGKVVAKQKSRPWIWAAIAFVATFGVAYGVLSALNGGSGSGLSSVRGLVDVMRGGLPSPDKIFEGRDNVTILVVGRDVDRNRKGQVMDTWGRTDTILFLRLCQSENKAYLLSIPRDMLVPIPGHGIQKINAAHSFGGQDLLIATLKSVFGLEVDHWVRVDFAGSKEIVDALGGVDVDVEKDMNYDDNWGQLHIHLKKGMQHLNGAQAHGYLRFRHDREGDIGRIRRQQQVIHAILKKMMQPNMLLRIPKVAAVMEKVTETDMNVTQLLSIAAFMKNLPHDGMETATLPGHPSHGQWVLTIDPASEILQKFGGSDFSVADWDASKRPRLASLQVPRFVPEPTPVKRPHPAPAPEAAPETTPAETAPAATDTTPPTDNTAPAAATPAQPAAAGPITTRAGHPAETPPARAEEPATPNAAPTTPQPGNGAPQEKPKAKAQTPPTSPPPANGGGEANAPQPPQ